MIKIRSWLIKVGKCMCQFLSPCESFITCIFAYRRQQQPKALHWATKFQLKCSTKLFNGCGKVSWRNFTIDCFSSMDLTWVYTCMMKRNAIKPFIEIALIEFENCLYICICFYYHKLHSYHTHTKCVEWYELSETM